MESIIDTMHRLTSQLKPYPWFAQQVLPNPQLHNSIVAYVNQINLEIESLIPAVFDGWQVRVHFVKSLSTLDTSPVKFNPAVLAPSNEEDEEDEEDEEFTTVLDIHNEIWKLKRICGLDTLEHIFFEVHDQENAVSDFSTKYPDVRLSMENLYDEFGFDLLHEELGF